MARSVISLPHLPPCLVSIHNFRFFNTIDSRCYCNVPAEHVWSLFIVSSMTQHPPVGHDLLIFDVSNSDTLHSVGLLWTNDRPIALISTWQQTPLSRQTHQYPGGIRTCNPSKRAAAYPRLRPLGNWDWPVFTVTVAYWEVMEQDSTPKHECFEWQLSAFESMYNWWSLFVLLLRRPGQEFTEHRCVARSVHTDCVDVSFASLLIQ
jgi:hypothetical protein